MIEIDLPLLCAHKSGAPTEWLASSGEYSDVAALFCRDLRFGLSRICWRTSVAHHPTEDMLSRSVPVRTSLRFQGRAKRAARADHRAYRSATRGRHLAERGALLSVFGWRPLGTLTRAWAPALPLLGPGRATAAAVALWTPGYGLTDLPPGRCRAGGAASGAIPPGALILKPCEFAVKGAPSGRVYDGASATLERRPRQGFRGSHRRDGQVRALLTPCLATAEAEDQDAGGVEQVAGRPWPSREVALHRTSPVARGPDAPAVIGSFRTRVRCSLHAGRGKLATMAFHENFWVVTGTAAPVIALANIVAIGDFWSLRDTFIAAISHPNEELARAGIRKAYVIYTVATVNMVIQAAMIYAALQSLSEGRNYTSPWKASIAESLGILACLYSALVTARWKDLGRRMLDELRHSNSGRARTISRVARHNTLVTPNNRHRRPRWYQQNALAREKMRVSSVPRPRRKPYMASRSAADRD